MEGHRVAIKRLDGQATYFDAVYLALGCEPLAQLIEPLGAAVDERGALIVDGHQQTSIKGLYAAGDIVRGSNQMGIAAAEGAIVPRQSTTAPPKA